MIKRKIRRILRRFSSRYRHLQTKIEAKSFWLGNLYGGFYVHPNQLSESSIVYSFGIGQDISFDLALISAYNCQVYGFDPTPKSINWINNQSLPAEFHFEPFGIARASGTTEFHLPINPDHVSGSIVSQKNVSESSKIIVAMKSLPDIMRELGHHRLDVFKMDIEGAEYDVIEALVASNIRPNQLLIEFHDRFFPDAEVPRSMKSVDLLASVGYRIFAVSDTFEEVSFIYVG